MAILKCKMCGANLEITEGMTVVNCEYCGTQQTVPNVDDEKKVTLFERANRLRMNNEFDKAAGVYETIVADFPTEAEAYWGLVLCRYGIEYVDDPASGKKIPTCHRSSFASIMDDKDFDQACENADVVARKLYREEAKVIEEIRKGIIEVSGKEEPYDIFICYKETDATGDRTIDSVLAQDVYDALTEKGYRVFFSRITLEDKLGQEYEPYIFAALNSAKIMLAFGTDYEYYNAAWVKNEWSRYLQLMNQDKSKHLIPCYKDIDAYDIPKEFAKLQAQDMGKVGAVQDLVRGIEKLLPLKKSDDSAAETVKEVAKEIAKETVVVQQKANASAVESLVSRANIYLSKWEWEKAEEYFNRAIDLDVDCTEAYMGLACVEKRKASLYGFIREYIIYNDPDDARGIRNNIYFQHAMNHMNESFEKKYKECEESVKAQIYEDACKAMQNNRFEDAKRSFEKIKGFRDADIKRSECEWKDFLFKKQEAEEKEIRKKNEEKEREANLIKLRLKGLRKEIPEVEKELKTLRGGFFENPRRKELQIKLEKMYAQLEKLEAGEKSW